MTIIPNTLDPRLCGLDWTYIDRVFSSCLHPSSHSASHSTSFRERMRLLPSVTLAPEDQNDCDVALKNLVGDGASDVAQRWADHGKLLKRLSYIRSHLGEEENLIIDNLLGVEERSGSQPHGHLAIELPSAPSLPQSKTKELNSRFYQRDSDEDSDEDNDDERGRTAHTLFASMAGIGSDDKENTWWLSSPASQTDLPGVEEALLQSKDKERSEPVGNGAWRINRLTPVSSPLRPIGVGIRGPIQSTPKKNVPPLKPAAAKETHAPSKSYNGEGPQQTPVSRPEKGHTLASPICLASSSPDPPIHRPLALQGARRVSGHASSTRAKGVVLSKPRALVFQTEPQRPSNHNSTEDHPTNTITTPKMEPRRVDAGMQDRVQRSSVPRKPIPFVESSPISRKRPSSNDASGTLSKKVRLEHQLNAPEPVGSRFSSSTTPNSTRIQSQGPFTKSPSPIPWVLNENEFWVQERLNMSARVATVMSHDEVAPSYPKKRERQIAQLERKAQKRAAGSPSSPKGVGPPFRHPAKNAGSSTARLGPQATVLSFETVHDETEDLVDWSRSRLLAEAIKKDLANGRKPVIPALQCAQSQSQSQSQS